MGQQLWSTGHVSPTSQKGVFEVVDVSQREYVAKSLSEMALTIYIVRRRRNQCAYIGSITRLLDARARSGRQLASSAHICGPFIGI